MPSFGSTSSHLERKHDGPTRQIPLNKALVAFKQVISSGLLDRTNVRICHHSRPICVSDVMSRYGLCRTKAKGRGEFDHFVVLLPNDLPIDRAGQHVLEVRIGIARITTV